jgi:hypothetical protein
MPPGTTRRPVPAAVVVDSRNVRGSFEAVFGLGREVRVPGVVQALAAYGFDAREVHVAIGTIDGGRGAPSQRLADSLARNQRYAQAIEQDPLGSVLPGRLVERDGEMGEKLVDVQCAIQIARSAVAIQNGTSPTEAIVVLSEDMDLIPAYRFAQDLGVPVYAASHKTVDTRPDCSWLLLTEGALAACSRPPGRYYGSGLRRQILGIVDNVPNVQLRFKVRVHERANNRLRLVHNSGALAICNDIRGLPTHRDADVQLHVLGIAQPDGSYDFPQLLVGQAPPAGPPPDIVGATAVRWTTATRVEVRTDSGAAHTVNCPPGTVLPGMPVRLLDRPHGPQQRARTLLGSTQRRPPTPGWGDPALPELVTVTSSAGSPGALVRAVLGTGQEITLQPPGNSQAKAGDTYAAVPADHVVVPGRGVHVQAVAVSSPLGQA